MVWGRLLELPGFASASAAGHAHRPLDRSGTSRPAWRGLRAGV